MIVERATVIEVETDSILVETVQQSTCGSCVAQKGCGQGVLAKYLSSSSFFRIDTSEFKADIYQPGDIVELGIDEFAIVRASLWLYLLPLAGLVAGAYLGSLNSEAGSILTAIAGLVVGGYLTSKHARRVKDRPEYAPTLVADTRGVRIISSPSAA